MSEPMPEGAPSPAAPEPPAEPTFAIDPDEYQALQDQVAQLSQLVQPQQQPWQQPAQQGPPIPDPFAPDYADQFQAYVEHTQAPLRQWQQQQELTAAQEQAMTTLAGFAEKDGAFDQGMAWARANQLILENGGDPHKALAQAANDVRAYEQRLRDEAIRQYQEQLQVVAGAPRGLPVGVGGTQTVPTGGLGNVPNAVTRKFFGGP